jgi:hypothetical protein
MTDKSQTPDLTITPTIIVSSTTIKQFSLKLYITVTLERMKVAEERMKLADIMPYISPVFMVFQKLYLF